MEISNNKIFGYARVSTQDQKLDLQIDSLIKEGCKPKDIFKEKISGRKKVRPEFEKLMGKIRSGDTLIVYDLDRLGRTSKELIQLLDHFKNENIAFKSITQGLFDTTSPMGEAIFQIMAILKAMEVNVLSERTKEGMKASRKRGISPGRKKGSIDEKKYYGVIAMYKEGKSWKEIEQTQEVSRSTISSYLKISGIKK